jgi:hypothetical protein
MDWARATREVESLLEGQWRDGMVPHVRYDPARLDGYFPGPARWPGAAARTVRTGVLTSGISNPPVVVSAALQVGRRQPDHDSRMAFWGRVYPALAAWLSWFGRTRRLPGSPLPVIVHPWESGWDNSPRWDFLRAAALRPRTPYRRLDQTDVLAAERPTDREYDAYIALVDLLDESDYDLGRYQQVSPFLVNDVVVDATWYRAALDLGEIAAALDLAPPFPRSELEEFAAAFEEVHWSPGCQSYVDYDTVAGRRIEVSTPAGLVALLTGMVPGERPQSMWERYLATGLGLRPLWTATPDAAGFDPARYWRGPVWAQLNWLVGRGLAIAGLPGLAAGLDASTLSLIAEGGFAEHFSPVDGRPGGAGSFSWTAAVALELLDPPATRP